MAKYVSIGDLFPIALSEFESIYTARMNAYDVFGTIGSIPISLTSFEIWDVPVMIQNVLDNAEREYGHSWKEILTVFLNAPDSIVNFDQFDLEVLREQWEQIVEKTKFATTSVTLGLNF